MPATERDVAELAEWLYDRSCDRDNEDWPGIRGTFAIQADWARRPWLDVARALLDSPPDVVRRAVRRMEVED